MFKDVTCATFQEFISDPELFKPVVDKYGLYQFWKDKLHDSFDYANYGSDYDNIILSCARGSGQTIASLISLAYALYRMMHIDNPEEYFKCSNPEVVIYGVNIKSSLDLLDEFVGMLWLSPWFQNNGKFTTGEETNSRRYVPNGVYRICVTTKANIGATKSVALTHFTFPQDSRHGMFDDFYEDCDTVRALKFSQCRNNAAFIADCSFSWSYSASNLKQSSLDHMIEGTYWEIVPGEYTYNKRIMLIINQHIDKSRFLLPDSSFRIVIEPDEEVILIPDQMEEKIRMCSNLDQFITEYVNRPLSYVDEVSKDEAFKLLMSGTHKVLVPVHDTYTRSIAFFKANDKIVSNSDYSLSDVAVIESIMTTEKFAVYPIDAPDIYRY